MYSDTAFYAFWFIGAGLFNTGFGTYNLRVSFFEFRKCFLFSAIMPGNIKKSSYRRIQARLKKTMNKAFGELALGAAEFLTAAVFFTLAFIQILPK